MLSEHFLNFIKQGDSNIRLTNCQILCQSPQAVLVEGLASPWRLRSRGNGKNPAPLVCFDNYCQPELTFIVASTALFASRLPDTVLLRLAIHRLHSKTPVLVFVVYLCCMFLFCAISLKC
jgi:hypothetical protein